MSRDQTFIGGVALVTEECCAKGCGITFAMTADLRRRRLADHGWFYCPNGHQQHYTGPSDSDRLRDEQAKNTHLRDQLLAAALDAEAARKALVRDRHRFANGVCPCCNRFFENVNRHMKGEHPDYDVTKVRQAGPVMFKCSCGQSFDTLRGLGTHQGHRRHEGWASPETPKWRAHLTEVGAR